jgi:hypothetical protein
LRACGGGVFLLAGRDFRGACRHTLAVGLPSQRRFRLTANIPPWPEPSVATVR